MLTDTKVNGAKPRPYKLSDGRGLYLYVSQTGARIWRYACRIDGKERTFVIGDYDKDGISLADTPRHGG
jgi:Arm DNA-binding domain